MSTQSNKILYICFDIFLLTGALLRIFDVSFAVYIFAVGTLGGIVSAFVQVYRNQCDDIRKKRLLRIQFLSSLVLALGTYLMYTGSNSWVVMLLLYALITLFLSWRFK